MRKNMLKEDTPGYKLLIVEDNPGDHDLVTEYLDMAGLAFRAENAPTLDDAITMFQDRAFDLAILDLGLPDSQGLDTLNTFIRRFPRTPVIALTGQDDDELARLAIHEGAQDYLIKGKISPDQMMRAIRYAIERKNIENELEAIYDNAPVLMMLVNQDRTILRLNEMATAFAQRSEAELIGLRGGDALHCLHSRQDPQGCGFAPYCSQCGVRNAVLYTLETGERVQNLETSFPISQDGESNEVFLSVSTSLITINRGLRVLVCIQDITERKLADAEKQRLEEQVRQGQKMESIGRLAGGVAHDLNNMLTPILGYSELLLMEVSDADARESVQEIHSASLRAQNMVSQLLAFGRKQTLQVQKVDLNDTLTDLEKLLRRTIREDIEIAMHLDEELPNVQADVGQIEQVIMNLAINAQDAMPGGGKLIFETHQVELDTEYVAKHPEAKTGSHVLLAIHDTGQGMDKETVDQLFEPFFTTKEKGKGTGLGLATVHGIIKQHGGNIWVYSEPGIGTTFKVYLPVVEQEIADNMDQATQSEKNEGTETVMVVEDDPNVRKLTTNLLKQHGYSVISASSGNECLEKLSEYTGPLDLLLTDMIMPEMNGKDLFEQVKQSFPRIRVLYMSGYPQDVISKNGVLGPEINFIQKPFTVQNMAAKVRVALDGPIPPGSCQ